MALPDQFEYAGVVLGSAILLAPLASVPAGILVADPSPAVQAVLWLGPGTVIGVLVATEVVPVTYRQVWTFALASILAVFVVDGVLRTVAATDPASLALGWLFAVVVSVAFASRKPL